MWLSRAGLMTSNHHRENVQRNPRENENISRRSGNYWTTSKEHAWGPRSRSERRRHNSLLPLNVLSDTCLGWRMSTSFLLVTSYYFTVLLGGTVFSPCLVGRHSGCFWLVAVVVADKVAIVILICPGTGLWLDQRIPLCKLAKGVPPGRRGPGGTWLGKRSVRRLDSSPIRSSAGCPCAVNNLHVCIWWSRLSHSILFSPIRWIPKSYTARIEGMCAFLIIKDSARFVFIKLIEFYKHNKTYYVCYLEGGFSV